MKMLHIFWQSDILRLNCCRLLFKYSFIHTEADAEWNCGCLCLSVSPVVNGLSVFEPFVHEVSPITLSRTKYVMYKKRKQGGTEKYPVQEGKRLYSSIKLNFGTRFFFCTLFPVGWRVISLASESSSLRPEQTLEWPEKRVPSIPGIIWKAIISV